jgi:hypothetical protein
MAPYREVTCSYIFLASCTAVMKKRQVIAKQCFILVDFHNNSMQEDHKNPNVSDEHMSSIFRIEK